ncbi:MAG: sulfite exporter TauE/SafE family protein [Nitrospiraceae bacterium]
MGHELALLALTAAAVGVLHTVLGPDHYLPFVLMGRAERWSRAKTLWVTLACGLGHVLSSVALGAVGITLGVAVARLEAIEAIRGQLAAWALIAFGLVYFVWGLRRAQRNRPHVHVHPHLDGTVHIHRHTHVQEHLHVHGEHARPRRLTLWVLFILFLFGPCEALIPLLMYPAAQSSTGGVAVVTAVFGVATMGTMLVIVLVMLRGIEKLPLGILERYTHALAGAALALCGVTIAVLGV